MKLVVYGAGKTGMLAADFLGLARVECFIDNSKAGKSIEGINVISFSDFLEKYDPNKCLIVIASEKYYEEIETSVVESGVSKYFVFRERDIIDMEFSIFPRVYLYKKWIPKSYNEILSNYKFANGEKIGIYGVNNYLPYLLIELNERINLENCYILTEDGSLGDCCKTFGVRTKRIDECWNSIDCMIINARRKDSNIHEKLSEQNHSFEVIDLYSVDYFVPQFFHGELAKYKDIHKGKRAFLIGNGPSLNINDLEKLYRHNEICIGCNKIYRAYSETKWRANYICMSDYRTINACLDDIQNIDGTVFLADTYHMNSVPELSGIQYIHLIGELFAPHMPGFSEDIRYGVYMGWNILYDLMIQIAYYMGFEKMYLLGVDHQLSAKPMEDGNHFIKNYFNENEKKEHEHDSAAFDMISKKLGYQKAEAFSRSHGFRIFNATRGGALDTFERVDFDSLFE